MMSGMSSDPLDLIESLAIAELRQLDPEDIAKATRRIGPPVRGGRKVPPSGAKKPDMDGGPNKKPPQRKAPLGAKVTREFREFLNSEGLRPKQTARVLRRVRNNYRRTGKLELPKVVGRTVRQAAGKKEFQGMRENLRSRWRKRIKYNQGLKKAVDDTELLTRVMDNSVEDDDVFDDLARHFDGDDDFWGALTHAAVSVRDKDERVEKAMAGAAQVLDPMNQQQPGQDPAMAQAEAPRYRESTMTPELLANLMWTGQANPAVLAEMLHDSKVTVEMVVQAAETIGLELGPDDIRELRQAARGEGITPPEVLNEMAAKGEGPELTDDEVEEAEEVIAKAVAQVDPAMAQQYQPPQRSASFDSDAHSDDPYAPAEDSVNELFEAMRSGKKLTFWDKLTRPRAYQAARARVVETDSRTGNWVRPEQPAASSSPKDDEDQPTFAKGHERPFVRKQDSRYPGGKTPDWPHPVVATSEWAFDPTGMAEAGGPYWVEAKPFDDYYRRDLAQALIESAFTTGPRYVQEWLRHMAAEAGAAIEPILARQGSTASPGTAASDRTSVLDPRFERLHPRDSQGRFVEKAAVPVLKAADEKRFTLGPFYVPDRNDAHNEWATGDDLREGVWKYMRKGKRDIYLQHTRKRAGEFVELMAWPYEHEVELWHPGMAKDRSDVRKAKMPANTAYMGVVWEPWAWEMVKRGELRGLSMGGSARRIEAEFITKHGDHDQEDHGNWARGGGGIPASTHGESGAATAQALMGMTGRIAFGEGEEAPNVGTPRELPRGFGGSEAGTPLEFEMASQFLAEDLGAAGFQGSDGNYENAFGERITVKAAGRATVVTQYADDGRVIHSDKFETFEGLQESDISDRLFIEASMRDDLVVQKSSWARLREALGELLAGRGPFD